MNLYWLLSTKLSYKSTLSRSKKVIKFLYAKYPNGCVRLVITSVGFQLSLRLAPQRQPRASRSGADQVHTQPELTDRQTDGRRLACTQCKTYVRQAGVCANQLEKRPPFCRSCTKSFGFRTYISNLHVCQISLRYFYP